MTTRRLSSALPLVVAVLAVLASTPPAAAEVHRWLDARGTMNYSDTPPQRSSRETPESIATSRPVIDAALADLSASRFDRLVGAYRFFEESWTPAYVAGTRQMLTRYFTVMREELGQPTEFQPQDVPASLTLDPVPDRLWNASDCVFTEHAYTATFVTPKARRPGDVFVQVCYSPRSNRAWLRAVTLVMGPPIQLTIFGVSTEPMDPAFEQAMTRYFTDLQAACKAGRLDPDSCVLSALSAAAPEPAAGTPAAAVLPLLPPIPLVAVTPVATAPHEAAPNLPPCGRNDKASRTWVDIVDGKGQTLYGFCAFKTAADLDRLWFSVEVGQPAPAEAAIVVTDRQTQKVYRSNAITIR